MIDPYEENSIEQADDQLVDRWENDVSELEAEDWEQYFSGPEENEN